MKMQTSHGLRRWKRRCRKMLSSPKVRLPLDLAGSFLAGLCLSAASLGNMSQPVCLAVLCAGLPGWLPVPFALGGCLGYWTFWGQSGLQGIVWIAAGLPVCVILGMMGKKIPLLPSGLAGLVVAVSGVVFQFWQGEETSIAMYLLRIALAAGGTWLVQSALHRQEATAQWLSMGLVLLALAQVAPLPYLNLGFLVAAVIALTAPFPAVAVAGLALDLAGISSVPMTAVLCMVYLLRMIPWLPRGSWPILPGAVYFSVMILCGQSQYLPIPALVLGGMGSLLLPRQGTQHLRRGDMGFAQARLEMVSGVMAQARQLLQETLVYPMDEGALMARVADRACQNCPHRQGCPEAERVRYLPQTLLHQANVLPESIPSGCSQSYRLQSELQRGQDQYRMLRADRQRQEEYRGAVIQQYGFLAEYLQELSDNLPQREETAARFRPEVAVCSRGKEAANGDRCLRFAGTRNRYYVLLCDGMGTGDGAAFEARTAGSMLRRMLMAGYPAHYALQSLNSICVLRGSAGAVTVDLVEADLVTGRASLYKWGAAPSWLLGHAGPERIGREGPPPGISVGEGSSTVDRVTLQHGVPLVLLSDGVDGSNAVSGLEGDFDQPAGFLAALILEAGYTQTPDDATAAVLRLHRLAGK
ncbi:MAG: SpoIIE family protein phosphatase [Oscillospiraceae bacterium]|nr:SpoIIE family protein phosphatase [Oscillospiraceae bacterium]